ncbi:spore protease YyaC [Anaerosalibacter massiliensis]|uniref:Spore protease YyaC n=1 Tax=Anaerosalibacter massiliensis TaxID=1347392 RepID=A0A9X2MQQ4_9FIRM|nr:spore protease YyaC [Anaerosalibacter massiliensis]MCR2045471.1 spore protease YyaC [Anaerosalibacter massiliensis]
MKLYSNTNKYTVDSKSPLAVSTFSDLISEQLISKYVNSYKELIILCIGSDRSTGDALGPLVGYKLEHILSIYEDTYLLGTLEKPVHAKNLEEKIDYIYDRFLNPFIIAIDASLGRADRIGYLNIKDGPLNPGLGVNKKLPKIGDLSITGVVNIGGMMEYVVLQNTRLNLVMNMAEAISQSIYIALLKISKEKNGEDIS